MIARSPHPWLSPFMQYTIANLFILSRIFLKRLNFVHLRRNWCIIHVTSFLSLPSQASDSKPFNIKSYSGTYGEEEHIALCPGKVPNGHWPMKYVCHQQQWQLIRKLGFFEGNWRGCLWVNYVYVQIGAGWPDGHLSLPSSLASSAPVKTDSAPWVCIALENYANWNINDDRFCRTICATLGLHCKCKNSPPWFAESGSGCFGFRWEHLTFSIQKRNNIITLWQALVDRKSEITRGLNGSEFNSSLCETSNVWRKCHNGYI